MQPPAPIEKSPINAINPRHFHQRNDSTSTVTGKRKLDQMSGNPPEMRLRGEEAAAALPSTPEEGPPSELNLIPLYRNGTSSEASGPLSDQPPDLAQVSSPHPNLTESPSSTAFIPPEARLSPDHPSSMGNEDQKSKEVKERQLPEPRYDSLQRADTFDIPDLEQRFIDSMETMGKKTEAIQREWVELIELFNVYASTVPNHDPKRYHKRLSTRLRRLEMEEDRLEGSRQNYVQVVKAFDAAFSLIVQDTR